jgi:hypothetical protein
VIHLVLVTLTLGDLDSYFELHVSPLRRFATEIRLQMVYPLAAG